MQAPAAADTAAGQLRASSWSGVAAGADALDALHAALASEVSDRSYSDTNPTNCRRRRRLTLRRESRAGPPGAVSLLGLTPGTPFMGRVEAGLAFYACQRLQNRAWQDLAFEVSGSTVPVSKRFRKPYLNGLRDVTVRGGGSLGSASGCRHVYGGTWPSNSSAT